MDIQLPSRTQHNSFSLSIISQMISLFDKSQNIVNCTRKRIKSSFIGNVSNGDAANFARVICAVNLQSLSSLLNSTSTWAFSLANDSSTHYDDHISIIEFIFTSMEFCTISMHSQSPCLSNILLRICSSSSLDFSISFVHPGVWNSLMWDQMERLPWPGDFMVSLLNLNDKLNTKYIEHDAIYINWILWWSMDTKIWWMVSISKSLMLLSLIFMRKRNSLSTCVVPILNSRIAG